MSSVRSRTGSAQLIVDKPTPAPRRGSVPENENFILDCKAAYLAVFDDLTVEIESKRGLCEVLQQAGRSPTSKLLAKYWKTTTDSLTFDDFCDICRKEPATTEDDVIKAFRRIDVNGDGYISNSELRKMLTTRGEKMTIEEVQKIIDEVDENGDGRLDYREFAKMIMKTQQESKTVAYKYMEKKLAMTSSKSPASPRAARTYPVEVAVYKKDDSDTDEDIIISSRATTRSSRNSLVRNEDVGKTTPRTGGQEVREWSKAGVSKQLSLVKPPTLRDWKTTKSKGCFFYDERQKIISHQYSLRLTQDTNVWITIEPLILMRGDLNSKCEATGCPVDMMIFVLDTADSLVAFSDQRDVKGKYAVSCQLSKGPYKLLAFTTGCRFRQRTLEPSGTPVELVNRKKDGQVTLTREFKEALSVIFTTADLSCNDLWSRDEFRLFNLHTSGQELGDSEWQVVEDKIELENGSITWKGYLQLTEMEAEDLDDSDDSDLWVTLDSMGFNKALVMDNASPFMLEVYAERCAPSLKATKIDEGGKILSSAVVAMVKKQGQESRVRGSKDLFLHSFATDFRLSLVVENRSNAKQSVVVDCRKSENVTSSHPQGLACNVDVPAKSSVVAHHLLPKKDSQSWSVVCAESAK